MVLVVLVVSDATIVDEIEEGHAAEQQLEVGRDAGTLGQSVFVLPSPPGPGEQGSRRLWVLVATTNPGADLAQLQLRERGVLWNT